MFVAVRKGPDGPAPDPAGLLAALTPGVAADRTGVHDDPLALVVQALRWATPEAEREQVPHHDPTTGCVVAAWVRLDDRAGLGRELGWDAARVEAATDPALLAAAWDRWGTGCAARLVGDLAFAVWDPRTRTLFAARDPLGIRPCHWAQAGATVAVGTTAAAFAAVPGVDTSPSAVWAALHLVGASRTDPERPLVGVRELPPGHWLCADDDGVRVERYHHWRDDAPWEDTLDERWLEAYRDVLVEAVRARRRAIGRLGVETSGGIDSSTVLALLAWLDPDDVDRLVTFGHATHELEPAFILRTSERYGIRDNHIHESLRGEGGLERGILALGHPPEHANAISYVRFYREAAELGVRSLFSGHGGDEVVTNYAPEAMGEMFARRAYRAAWRAHARRGFARVGAMALRAVRPGRFVLPVPGPRPEDLAVLRPEVVRSLDLVDRLAAAARSPQPTVNQAVLHRWLGPGFSARCAECSTVATSYGIDYRWPLYDARLVQQYLSTPTVWKFGEGMGRYLHRRAVSGIVPDEIVWKPSKDMGPLIAGERTPAARPAVVARADELLATLPPLLADLIDPDAVRARVRSGEQGAGQVVGRLDALVAWTS